ANEAGVRLARYPDRMGVFTTDKELALDIGKFGVEVGLTMKNLPAIVLNYDRDFKQGTKSRLSWSRVYFGSGNNDHFGLAPSWENIDEITDSFNVKVSDSFKEFNWKAEQHWEYTRAKHSRNVTYLSSESAPAASHTEVIDYKNQPRSNLIMTTLGLDRWFMKDKVYASGGYRFSEVDNWDIMNVLLLKPDGTFLPGSNVIASPATNRLVTQTWVGCLMTTLFNPLSIIGKVKIEEAHRRGEATRATDSDTDGLINSYTVSDNTDKISRLGESISLRYSGIPRVALYNDYEFEQNHNNVFKNFVSGNSRIYYQDINDQFIGSGTIGARIIPWNQVTLTIQDRYKREDNGYDRPLISGSPLRLIDAQAITSDEATLGVAWKPNRYFQPAFRYQLVDMVYKVACPRTPDYFDEADQLSNVYTWDLTSLPTDQLLLNASFSMTDGKATTTNRYVSTIASAPTFNFDSYTTLFSASYSVNKDVTLIGTADYTRAVNFNDFSSVSVPLGADFHQADMTFGCRWQVRKDFTLEPKFGWYTYQANEAEVGSFTAQTYFLEGKMKWG
ncbi:MAG: hypothetical protein WCG06_01395, partial [Candidatus Omnitrophota bacterium]